jgi:hypothetical protein
MKKSELEMIVFSLENLSNRDLPIWHELTINIRAVRPFYMEYRKRIDEIIKKYSVKIEDNQIDWGGNQPKANKELEKLHKEEIDVKFTKIELSETILEAEEVE